MPSKATVVYSPDRAPDAVIDGDNVRLACYTDGDPAQPALVFVHGYPDTAHVWDRLIDRLARHFFCVRYDVRGAGRSERPHSPLAYRLEHLKHDLAAVIDWASPTAAIHLIGHDWGSIQSWEAATDPAMAERIATFTTLSGPCLDHLGRYLRSARAIRPAALLQQLRRSWYIGVFHLPIVAPLLWRRLLAGRWPQTLARLEGETLPVAPTLANDGRYGIQLYRANVVPRLLRPRARRALMPVQAIVARRDPFVSPAIAQLMSDWVADLTVDEIDAGHWAIMSHAPTVADLIERYLWSHLEHHVDRLSF
ncbi:alpha/beta fold hydrolase [Salinisphaera sp. SPP-AMP-43]|uniref:alpha/beta fold hydrolase n=1 Tax=Salinisphaera sp. SPP-AMP-43 TaxID=3121288 RepID=UPI003C6DE895